jgi:hypothetical protein
LPTRGGENAADGERLRSPAFITPKRTFDRPAQPLKLRKKIFGQNFTRKIFNKNSRNTICVKTVDKGRIGVVKLGL